MLGGSTWRSSRPVDQITPETARTALLWLRRTVENRFPGVRCAGAETLDLPFLVVEVPGYSYGDNDVIVRWDTRRQTFIVNEDHVSPADLRKATLDAVKRMMRKARRGGAALHVPRRNPPTARGFSSCHGAPSLSRSIRQAQ